MKRTIIALVLAAAALTAAARTISYIENTGSWIYLYDENERRYKTLSPSTLGEIKGYSSEIFVAVNGSWLRVYDAEGKCLATLSASNAGEVIGV